MFLPIHRVHFSEKEAISTKFCAKQAKLKAFAGCMLCTPGLRYHQFCTVIYESVWKSMQNYAKNAKA